MDTMDFALKEMRQALNDQDMCSAQCEAQYAMLTAIGCVNDTLRHVYHARRRLHPYMPRLRPGAELDVRELRRKLREALTALNEVCPEEAPAAPVMLEAAE